MERIEGVRLTPAQRMHFDIYGYVLLEDVLTRDEIARMKAAVHRMNEDPDLDSKKIPVRRKGTYYVMFERIIENDPALLEFAVHSKLVPLVEDVVGGAVRLEESVAVISSRNPENCLEDLFSRRYNPTGFHAGTQPGWGTYEEKDRFHCLFVKTLAYLTDVGQDDGGTTVIPGSHKLPWARKELIEAAMVDDSLIRQIEAKAGSVLLFPESLVHSGTAMRSDKERTVLIYGYTPPMLREWTGHEISPEFIDTLPEEIRPLISGSDNWRWRRNY